MKLYISCENEEQKDNIKTRFETTDDYEESDNVLILPGSLGTLNDLIKSLIDNKKTYVYNENSYYDKIIEQIEKSRVSGIDSLTIENNLEELLNKMEVENGKSNNGESSKLL